MLTLEAIRSAALADQPWQRLDEMVRGELSAGRRVREVAEDFIRLRHDVADTPGLSEDGFDAFGDTMDALTGNCSQKSAYKDPPTLPTVEEIAKLPQWARVAFAARCARRVVRRLTRVGVGVIDDETPAIRAVAATEAAATHATALAGSEQLAAAMEAAAVRNPDYIVGQIKYTALHTVSLAVRVASDPLPALVVETAASAAKCVAYFQHLSEVTSGSGRGGVNDILSRQDWAIMYPTAVVQTRADIRRLTSAAGWAGWTDDTPVSPDVFGPLWPEGPPVGWPADPDLPQRTELPLTVAAGEGVAPDRLVDEVVNLFNALNRYHIARTGRRLTLEGDVHTRLPARVPAGAA